MASLLKDLFSLLKALLTLLFVVFLAVTRPSNVPEGQAEADSTTETSSDLAIPRVVTMKLALPYFDLTKSDEAAFSILPSYQRLAIYPQMNDQPSEPSGWRVDTTISPTTLKTTVEGHDIEWRLSVASTRQIGRFPLHDVIVAAVFEERSLEIFPLRFAILVELETPKITDEMLSVWNVFADAGAQHNLESRQLYWSPRAEIQVTGEQSLPITTTVAYAARFLKEPGVIFIAPDDLSKPGWRAVSKELITPPHGFRLDGTRLRRDPSSLLPDSPARKSHRIGLLLEGIITLSTEADGAEHPPLKQNIRVIPTRRLPPPDKSVLPPLP